MEILNFLKNILSVVLCSIIFSTCMLSSMEKPHSTVMVVSDSNDKQTFEGLSQGSIIGAFATENLYMNTQKKAYGVRFIHRTTGMPVTLFHLETSPQFLITVKTYPDSDKGEPHTGEHLVLGKGAKGKYMSLAMDMLLGENTAATYQHLVAYHYNCSGGKEAFFSLLGPYLDTIINPDFSDEEIRREVCHIGVFEDPETGQLSIDEKGTIYNEMVSSFEKRGFRIWQEIRKTIYGPHHPMGYSSGGVPKDIRTMTAEDINTFHQFHYRFGPNTEAVIIIPPSITIEEMLAQLDSTITKIRVDSDAEVPAKLEMPVFQPAPDRQTIYYADYPSDGTTKPGIAYYTWGPLNDESYEKIIMSELLIKLLASGESSYLYKDLVASDTRLIEPGASDISPFVWYVPGYPAFISIDGFPESAGTTEYLDEMRTIILNRIHWLANLEENSPQLLEVHKRFTSLLTEYRRYLRQFSEESPRFGSRSSGIWLYQYLTVINTYQSFNLSLTMDPFFDSLEQEIASGKNVYHPLIKQYGMDQLPYAFSIRANPDLIREERDEKAERLAHALENIQKTYQSEDPQEALRLYKEDFDEKTRVIEARDNAIHGPALVKNPPLTYDDALTAHRENLTETVPIVWNLFENTSFLTIGVAFNIRDLDEKFLDCLPIFPELLTGLGVLRDDGTTLTHEKLESMLRETFTHFYGTYDGNSVSKRLELLCSIGAGNSQNGKEGLQLLTEILKNPQVYYGNISRIQDLIKSEINSLTSRLESSEENWVSSIANAAQNHDDPYYQAVFSIHRKLYLLHRLTWKLTEPPASPDEIQDFIEELRIAVAGKRRIELLEMVQAITQIVEQTDPETKNIFSQNSISRLCIHIAEQIPKADKNDCLSMLNFIAQMIALTPPAESGSLIEKLLTDIQNDWLLPPQKTLDTLENLYGLLQTACSVRFHFTGNSDDKTAMSEALTACSSSFASTLSPESTLKNTSAKPSPLLMNINSRYKNRKYPHRLPTFLGYVLNETQQGVIINRSPAHGLDDIDENSLLDILSIRLFGGSGAHGLFMQTWGAGLAYSNGISASLSSRRYNYYAERCNDLVKTMSFVRDILNQADETIDSEEYVDYALSSLFAYDRSGMEYSWRGKEAADDIADNCGPEKVRRYRQALLSLRNKNIPVKELIQRLPQTAGSVIIGYGEKMHRIDDAFSFFIAPDFQLDNVEKYLQLSEGDVQLYRIYPSDFWTR